MTIYSLYEEFKTILVDFSTVEHIFIGEISTRGLAVGFHHEGELSIGTSKVIEETRRKTDSQGVYEANVIIRKIRKNGLSSFFPIDYSPEQVLKLIEVAYNNKKKVKMRLYEASLENGILIHFYQNDDTDSGKTTTAYPKYQI
jgi:hypothetical protein